MSSAEFNVGVSVSAKSSSRVLKPPGGGSSIFTGPEVVEHKPRNMKNQQNSTSMNEVMGTVDPNIRISQKTGSETLQHVQDPSKEFVTEPKIVKSVSEDKPIAKSQTNGGCTNQSNGTRGKVPPGGFSAGFW